MCGGIGESVPDVTDGDTPTHRPERFSRNRTVLRSDPEPPSEFEQLEEELRALAKRYGWDVVDRHWVTVRRQIEQVGNIDL